MSYTVVPATPDHGIMLHVYLSEPDREELQATQCQPLAAIMRGIFDSSRPISIFDKHGDIAAIAGIVPVTLHEAAPWLLCTDAARTEPITFARGAKKWVDEQLEIYSTLAHEVYRHNHAHIKLLELLGFTVESPRHASQLFLPFIQCASPPPLASPASP